MEIESVKRIEQELNGGSAHRGTVPEFHRIDSPRDNFGYRDERADSIEDELDQEESEERSRPPVQDEGNDVHGEADDADHYAADAIMTTLTYDDGDYSDDYYDA